MTTMNSTNNLAKNVLQQSCRWHRKSTWKTGINYLFRVGWDRITAEGWKCEIHSPFNLPSKENSSVCYFYLSWSKNSDQYITASRSWLQNLRNTSGQK